MTAQQAISTLAPRLRFGDEAQISAVRFLEEVEELRVAIHNAATTLDVCPACEGGADECAMCMGFGIVDRLGDVPMLFNPYDSDVIREAVRGRK